MFNDTLAASQHAEEAILASVIREPALLDHVSSRVRVEHFTPDSPMQGMYREMLVMSEAGIPIDTTLLGARLEATNSVPQAYTYITGLYRLLPQPENVNHYIDVVLAFAQRREVSHAAKTLYEIAAAGGDPSKVYRSAQETLHNLELSGGRNAYIGSDSAVSEYLDYLAERKNRVDGWEIPTGLEPLDAKLGGGFTRTSLNILAARPSVGKTAFALQIAIHVAMQGIPVAFHSLEMSRRELVLRMLASQSGLDSYRIRRGELSDVEEARLRAAVSFVGNLPLYIDDDAALTVSELGSRVRSLTRTLKNQDKTLGLVVVDYMQLMTNSASNRVGEVSYISRTLKLIAKTSDVPVLSLSQLSRALESRKGADRKPRLSDLRESGAIEQDADTVMFLTRENHDDPNSPLRTYADVHMAKNRNGPTGEALTFRFDETTTHFSLLAEGDEKPELEEDSDAPVSANLEESLRDFLGNMGVEF